MPSYKLYYFDITALGEPIRFLLSYGGASFEDVRVARDKWPALKPSMPMGQMPVLEIDGKQTHQSMAICRYLAKEFKVAGNNEWENFQIDIAVDTINDFRQKIGAVHYEANEQAKAEKQKLLVNEQLPFYLQKLDDMVKANKGYFVLGRLTWADLFFVSLLDYMNGMAKQDIIANHANLKAVRDNVLNVESIKKWMATRPKTEI